MFLPVKNVTKIKRRSFKTQVNFQAGQKKMQEVTDEAMSTISRNQDQLISNQENLQSKQAQIGSALHDNMNDILKEKRLIAQRHKQVEAYTHMINEQLGISYIKSLRCICSV